jgi:hypothetical protein
VPGNPSVVGGVLGIVLYHSLHFALWPALPHPSKVPVSSHFTLWHSLQSRDGPFQGRPATSVSPLPGIATAALTRSNPPRRATCPQNRRGPLAGHVLARPQRRAGAWSHHRRPCRCWRASSALRSRRVAAIYRAQVETLEVVLRDPDHGRKAFEIVRSLIEQVRIIPADGEGHNRTER